MRIGLFVDQDLRARSGLAATRDAIVAYRPHDSSIHQYAGPSTALALLRTRALAIRAAADRIDVVQIATTGPLALVALLIAKRLGLPVIGSFDPPSLASRPGNRAYVHAL